MSYKYAIIPVFLSFADGRRAFVISDESYKKYHLIKPECPTDELEVATNACRNYLYWAKWSTTGQNFRATVLSRKSKGNVKVILEK